MNKLGRKFVFVEEEGALDRRLDKALYWGSAAALWRYSRHCRNTPDSRLHETLWRNMLNQFKDRFEYDA